MRIGSRRLLQHKIIMNGCDDGSGEGLFVANISRRLLKSLRNVTLGHHYLYRYLLLSFVKMQCDVSSVGGSGVPNEGILRI